MNIRYIITFVKPVQGYPKIPIILNQIKYNFVQLSESIVAYYIIVKISLLLYPKPIMVKIQETYDACQFAIKLAVQPLNANFQIFVLCIFLYAKTFSLCKIHTYDPVTI